MSRNSEGVPGTGFLLDLLAAESAVSPLMLSPSNMAPRMEFLDQSATGSPKKRVSAPSEGRGTSEKGGAESTGKSSFVLVGRDAKKWSKVFRSADLPNCSIGLQVHLYVF